MKQSYLISFFTIIFLVSTMAIPAVLAKSEKEIPLSKVPQVVLNAAEKELPGIVFSEAEINVEENGDTFYELEGTLKGKPYELQISSDGKVMKSGLGEDSDVGDDPEDSDSADEKDGSDQSEE